MVSSCLKAHDFLYSPRGAIPPACMDSFLFGNILSELTSYTCPSPLQFLHIPLGELNEKVFGSGLG